MSGVSGPAEEHDLHVRPRHVPALRGSNERVSYLPQGHRAPHPSLLDLTADSCSSPKVCSIHACKATKKNTMAASAAAATPYAVAAVVWPPSQHLNQPVGLSTCLSLHYKPSLNGLTVFMWIFAVSFMHVTFFSPLTAALFWFSSPFLPSPRSTFPWVCFSTFRLLVLDINCSGRCTVAGFEYGWALSARAKKSVDAAVSVSVTLDVKFLVLLFSWAPTAADTYCIFGIFLQVFGYEKPSDVDYESFSYCVSMTAWSKNQ